MKKVSELKAKDFIAFGFNYNGGKANEIIVSNITSKNKGELLVHFMYGHHSLSEYIKQKDVIAIGNPEGKTKFRGWSGMFDLVKPNHHLITEEHVEETE